MDFGSLKSEFNGFDPGPALRADVKSVLENIQMLAPSDSSVKIVFEKENGTISATGKVVSLAGVYMAYEFDSDPETALKSIQCKLIDQLDSWKQSRFVSDDYQKRSDIQQVS